jgi:hypothetical protein
MNILKMFFASINEAFGVDSLEKPQEEVVPRKTTKVERVRFPTELAGESVASDDGDDIPTMIPEDRTITSLEVKEYLSNMYTKQGMKKVWELLDPKIKRKILSSCKSSIKNTTKWFDDILSSPEKLLIILAILFVLILLLDSSSKKAEAPAAFRPEQYYYYPQQQFNTPVELRW